MQTIARSCTSKEIFTKVNIIVAISIWTINSYTKNCKAFSLTKGKIATSDTRNQRKYSFNGVLICRWYQSPLEDWI